MYDEQEQCPCEAGLLKRQRRVGALSSLYAEGDFPRCERVCRIRSAVMSQFDLSGRPPIMAIVELDNFGEQYKSVHRVSLSETNRQLPYFLYPNSKNVKHHHPVSWHISATRARKL
jgi:hypothetical protein